MMTKVLQHTFDFRPMSPAAALFPYLKSMADQSFGMAFGEGVPGVSAMVNCLRAAGGENFVWACR